MADITADNTAAFISYSGEWDDSDETTRRTNTAGATLSLEFSGTALSVYGEYNPDDSGNFTYQLFDEQELSNNTAIIQAANAADRPFLAFHNLAKQPHTLTLSLVNGSLGVNRLVWFDPQARLDLDRPASFDRG
ncbi:hypothetical protein FRC12_007872 [Ceratobasidium sp. 428]|nr:hypothetical protein FRC12_007872 [Ceratobasidium sp. 428]